jgi:hypothetical protein
MANNRAPGGVNWAVLISAATLLIALFTSMWSLIQSQINTLAARNDAAVESVRRELADIKELSGSQREAIRHDLAQVNTAVAVKVDKDRFERVLDELVSRPEVQIRDVALQKQIDSLENRLINAQKDYISKEDIFSRFNAVNERINLLVTFAESHRTDAKK